MFDLTKSEYEKMKMNAPRERMATIYYNLKIKEAKENDPTLYDDKDKYKKMKARYLAEGRAKYGARKGNISFTDREW